MSVLTPVIDHLDLATKHIYLAAGVREYHPVTDIYCEVRNIRRLDETMRVFDIPVTAFGGVPKGGGKYTSRYAQFNHGWRIVPDDVSHSLYISGEQITDDGQSGPACLDTTVLSAGTNVIIHYEPPASELVKAEDELIAIQRMAFSEVITINVITGRAGTEWPIGTLGDPVNNLDDAITIAELNDITKLYFIGNFTFGTDVSISEYTLIGEGVLESTFTFVDGSVTSDCKIEFARVTGTSTGILACAECAVSDYGISGLVPSSASAIFKECLLSDTFSTPSNYTGTVVIIDSWSASTSSLPPLLDFNSAPCSLTLRNYSGNIELANYNYPGGEVSCDFTSGKIILGDTVVAGTFDLRGVCVLEDNSIPGNDLIIDSTGLISKGAVVESIEESIGPQIEYSSFNGYVSVNTVSGTAGTEFPIGTPRVPVSNITDAKTIANFRGFNKVYLESDLTITEGLDFTGFVFEGNNHVSTVLTIESAAIVDKCKIIQCTLRNCTLDDDIEISECIVENIDYINGHIHDCGLVGAITLQGDKDTVFANCYTIDQDNPAVIDMGGTGNSIAMPNYSGVVWFKNLSDPEQEIGLGMNAGYAFLMDTITAGWIIVAGSGLIDDQSTGAAIVNTDGLMNKELVAKGVWDEPIGNHLIAGTTGRSIGIAQFAEHVTIDILNGVAGTAFPTGTERVPVNNIPDAIAIANNSGLKRFHVRGDMTASGGPFTGYTVYGDNTQDTTITCVDLDCQGVVFEDCTISGTFINDSYITTKECVVKDVIDIELSAHRTSFGGFVKLNNSIQSKSVFYDCYDDIPGIGIPDIQVHDCEALGIWNWQGGIRLSNMTNPATVVSLMIAQGRLFVEETDVAGDIIVKGMADLRGETGGTTIDWTGLIDKSTISEAVWDEPIGNHLITGTTGRSIGLAQFAGVIHVSSAGTAGTAFPTGTERVPVNNMADAVAIAATNGISEFHFIDNFTITGGSYQGYVFTGHGRQSPTLTFDGTTIRFCQFKEIKVTGTFNNGSVIGAQFCVFDDASNMSIQAYECVFLGTIVLSNGMGFNDSNLYRCTDGVPGIGIPDIQVNTCASLGIWDWNGGIRLSNMTIDSAVTCMIAQGRLWVDETCVDGDIIVKGMADLRGETGGTTIDQTGLIDKGTIAEAVLDADITEHQTEDTVGFMFMKIAYANKIFLDTSTSNTGTDYPIGLPEHAVNNVDDARALMAKYECSELHLHSGITLDATHDFSNQYITGHTQDQEVTCTNPLVSNASFKNVTLNGTVVGRATYEQCKLNDLSGVAGHIEGCQVDGDIHFSNATTHESIMHNCTSISALGPTLHIYDETVICSQMSGAFTGANITTGTFGFGGDFCRVTLDASCTGGVAAIGTKGTIIDNSTGTFVALSNALTPETISDSVWSDSYSEYTTASGTMGYLQGTGGTGGLDEQALHDGMDSYPNKDFYKADTADTANAVWNNATAIQLTTDVEFIKSIEGGKWEIVNNQMIFYAEDSTTEIARFNLYNDAGVPGEENIYKRVRI